MSEWEVRSLMETMDAEYSAGHSHGDQWSIGGRYWITVGYESADAEPENRVLTSKHIFQLWKADSTDSFLEFLGLPKVGSLNYG
jgi:hypothetical protein